MQLRKVKLVQAPRWTTVYLTKDEVSLRIVKLKLENEGIPVMIFDQRDSSYNAFGDIYIQVQTELKEKALAIIEQS